MKKKKQKTGIVNPLGFFFQAAPILSVWSPYFVVPTLPEVSATGYSAKQIVSIFPLIFIKCAAL